MSGYREAEKLYNHHVERSDRHHVAHPSHKKALMTHLHASDHYLDAMHHYEKGNKELGDKHFEKGVRKGAKARAASAEANQYSGPSVRHWDEETNKESNMEQLDELSKNTLGSYIRKAASDKSTKAFKSGLEFGKNGNYATGSAKERKRGRGISRAVARLTKEENMSKTREIIDHLYDGNLDKMREAFHERMLPEIAGVLEAKRLEIASTVGLSQEEKEQLQELSTKKLMQYTAKAGRSTKDREKGIDKATKKISPKED